MHSTTTSPSADDCRIITSLFAARDALLSSVSPEDFTGDTDGVCETSTMSKKIDNATSQLINGHRLLFAPEALLRRRWVFEYDVLIARVSNRSRDGTNPRRLSLVDLVHSMAVY